MRKKILVLDDKIAIAKVLSIYLASDYAYICCNLKYLI